MNAPLALLHGYPFNHRMWDKVKALLPSDLQVLAPDLPGMGRPASDQIPSIEVMADAVKAELELKNIPRAVIAGFSMGGYVALAFAEKYATAVKAFILVNSQAAADSEEMRQGRRRMVETIRAKGIAPALEAAIPKMFARGKPVPEDLAVVPRKAAEQFGPEGLMYALEAMARRPDRTAVLKSVPGPVLIIHSAEDQFIPAERARLLAGEIKNAEYVEIPGAGHATPLEASEAVARAIVNFITRLS